MVSQILTSKHDFGIRNFGIFMKNPKIPEKSEIQEKPKIPEKTQNSKKN